MTLRPITTRETVGHEQLTAAAGRLLDDGWRLALVAGHDDRDRLRVVYSFLRPVGRRHELTVEVPRDDPRVPSLAHRSFPAGRFEREIRDQYGITPEGHPMRAVFDAATPGAERFALAPGGEVAWYEVDGRRQPDAPADRPFVLQRFRADGAVLSTAAATRESYVPDEQPEPEPVAEPLPVEPMPEPSRGARIGLGVSAGVLALGAGAAFTAAALAHDKYWDPATPPDHLARLQTTTNAATIGGAVLAAGAVGCATGAVFVARF